MGRVTAILLLRSVFDPLVAAMLCCWIGIFVLKSENLVFQALFLFMMAQYLFSAVIGVFAAPFMRQKGIFIGCFALSVLLGAFELVAFAAFVQFFTQTLIGRPLLPDGSALYFINALMATLSTIALPGLDFISPHVWNLVLGIISSILASYLWEGLKTRSRMEETRI